MIIRFYRFIDRKLGIRELLRYGTVGIIGASIDIGLLNVFVQFHMMDIYNALVLAFLISVVVSYFFHSHWTFKVRRKPMNLLVYCLSALVGLIINFTIMYLLIEGWGVWYNYAKLSAVFITVIWNYVISKTLIFNVLSR